MDRWAQLGVDDHPRAVHMWNFVSAAGVIPGLLGPGETGGVALRSGAIQFLPQSAFLDRRTRCPPSTQT